MKIELMSLFIFVCAVIGLGIICTSLLHMKMSIPMYATIGFVQWLAYKYVKLNS